jgi:hypothetical protein
MLVPAADRRRRATWALAASLAAAVSLACAGPAVAEEKSTPEERAKAVRLAHELQSEPFAPDADEKRRWLVRWYERIPDITVTVCNLLGPFPEGEHPYFKEVLFQTMFSGGAFIIEHPEKAGDAVAVQTAAVQGALAVYELSAARSRQRMPFLDELVAKRDQGTLGAHLKDAVPKLCTRP